MSSRSLPEFSRIPPGSLLILGSVPIPGLLLVDCTGEGGALSGYFESSEGTGVFRLLMGDDGRWFTGESAPKWDPNQWDPNQWDPNQRDSNQWDPNQWDQNQWDPDQWDPDQ